MDCTVSPQLTLASAALLLPPRVGPHLSQLVWCVVRRPVLCLIGAQERKKHAYSTESVAEDNAICIKL